MSYLTTCRLLTDAACYCGLFEARHTSQRPVDSSGENMLIRRMTWSQWSPMSYMYPISSPGACTCIMHSLTHVFYCLFLCLFGHFTIYSVSSHCLRELCVSPLASYMYVWSQVSPCIRSVLTVNARISNNVCCSTLALTPMQAANPKCQDYVTHCQTPTFSCKAS